MPVLHADQPIAYPIPDDSLQCPSHGRAGLSRAHHKNAVIIGQIELQLLANVKPISLARDKTLDRPFRVRCLDRRVEDGTSVFT